MIEVADCYHCLKCHMCQASAWLRPCHGDHSRTQDHREVTHFLKTFYCTSTWSRRVVLKTLRPRHKMEINYRIGLLFGGFQDTAEYMHSTMQNWKLHTA